MRNGAGIALALVVASLPLAACFKERERQIKQVGQDEAVLKGVTAAINQVIHNAADCDAVKAAMPEAQQRLSEAYGKVKEQASHETLKALSAQLKRVGDACP
ncbi:MAG TPA: hypothetical protein VFM88_05010 [Vicinamibacteria bacterium]|nr:hypothetical protein [Vicinamibacteria bacterium]